MVAFAQSGQQGQHTVKQGNVVGVLHVMETITLAQQRVFVLRHIRRGMGQCGHERHANHIRRSLVGRLGPTHIHHRRLNATGDDLRGVKQRAVPIEGNQIKLARACGHTSRCG